MGNAISLFPVLRSPTEDYEIRPLSLGMGMMFDTLS